jgi:hypothetical protein
MYGGLAGLSVLDLEHASIVYRVRAVYRLRVGSILLTINYTVSNIVYRLDPVSYVDVNLR